MRLKRIASGLHICSILACVGLLIYPIRSGPIKLLIVVCGVAAMFGILLWIRRPAVRWGLLSLLLCAALAVAFVPRRSLPRSDLQAEYVRNLRRYEGTRYVWGGESWMGVDCSGIVRSAWIDAHFRLGITSARPDLIRTALSAWWFDASAKELSLGYSGRARRL
jgi:hypothetical protein